MLHNLVDFVSSSTKLEDTQYNLSKIEIQYSIFLFNWSPTCQGEEVLLGQRAQKFLQKIESYTKKSFKVGDDFTRVIALNNVRILERFSKLSVDSFMNPYDLMVPQK